MIWSVQIILHQYPNNQHCIAPFIKYPFHKRPKYNIGIKNRIFRKIILFYSNIIFSPLVCKTKPPPNCGNTNPTPNNQHLIAPFMKTFPHFHKTKLLWEIQNTFFRKNILLYFAKQFPQLFAKQIRHPHLC